MKERTRLNKGVDDMKERMHCVICRKDQDFIITHIEGDKDGQYVASGYCSVCKHPEIWFSYLMPDHVKRTQTQKDDNTNLC